MLILPFYIICIIEFNIAAARARMLYSQINKPRATASQN